VVLVYLHGRLWRGAGVGLFAALLIGFNCDLLVQMQQATPTTLGLAGTLAVLLCYANHLRVTGEASVSVSAAPTASGLSSSRPWRWGGPVAWTVLGGVALGLTLMAVGPFGLACVPVIVLHQAYLCANAPRGRVGHARPAAAWWREWLCRLGSP